MTTEKRDKKPYVPFFKENSEGYGNFVSFIEGIDRVTLENIMSPMTLLDMFKSDLKSETISIDPRGSVQILFPHRIELFIYAVNFLSFKKVGKYSIEIELKNNTTISLSF